MSRNSIAWVIGLATSHDLLNLMPRTAPGVVVAGAGDDRPGRLAVIGKKVQMVINYDNFYLDPALADDYKALIRSLAERYYASATRYTTSSFMRLKLSEHLSDRGLAPHILSLIHI